MSQSTPHPFWAIGNTVSIIVTGASQSVAIATARPKNPESPLHVRTWCNGGPAVWSYGAAAATALATGVGANQIPIGAGSTEVIAVDGDTALVAAILLAGGSATTTMYFTPGIGL